MAIFPRRQRLRKAWVPISQSVDVTEVARRLKQ